MGNRLRIFILAVLLSSAVTGCGPRRGQSSAAASPASVKPVPFPEVEIPGMITEPAERMSYVLVHFWDGMVSRTLSGLCDSTHVEGVLKSDVEKQFGMYATLLWNAPVDEACSSVSRLFTSVEACEKRDTSSNVFETMASLVQKYLYDPNSPLRNEEFYLPYVKGLAASECTPETMRPAYSYDAEMCSMNRIGTRAADFSFTDLGGRVHTLYGVKADYTLLFFSNPGCPNCREITEMLESDEGIAAMESSGRLAVVNVYIDKEIDKWKSFASEYPSEWICGYDQNYIIREDQIYNVRAIPSLYLLDGDKRVLMKDAPQDKVFEKLTSIASSI